MQWRGKVIIIKPPTNESIGYFNAPGIPISTTPFVSQGWERQEETPGLIN